ncbi:Hypothetical predicted protein, partial [Pelobates cultripes]
HPQRPGGQSAVVIVPVVAASQSASSVPRFTNRKLRVIAPAFQDCSRCMRKLVCKSEVGGVAEGQSQDNDASKMGLCPTL